MTDLEKLEEVLRHPQIKGLFRYSTIKEEGFLFEWWQPAIKNISVGKTIAEALKSVREDLGLEIE